MDDAEKSRKKLEWLNSKWTQPRICPICNSTSWSVDQYSAAVPLWQASTLTLSPIYPLTSIHCNVCGYTMFFNDVIMGLSEPANIEPKKEGSEPKKEEAK
ncbi:MAG: hypothetical protein Q7U51_06750 [Methanoregula sp.]|nr:hypothetical protein [Methanoregula sp.]